MRSSRVSWRYRTCAASSWSIRYLYVPHGGTFDTQSRLIYNDASRFDSPLPGRAFVFAGIPVKISVERLFGSDVEVIDVDQSLRLHDELAARYPDGVRVTASIRRIQRGVYMEGEVAGDEVETCARCL